MNEKKVMTREEIDAAARTAIGEVFPVETETFGTMHIKKLDVTRRGFAYPGMKAPEDSTEFLIRYFIASVVDEAGNYLYELNDESIATVGKYPPKDVDKVGSAAVQLNNKAQEEILKNSETSQTTDSVSV